LYGVFIYNGVSAMRSLYPEGVNLALSAETMPRESVVLFLCNEIGRDANGKGSGNPSSLKLRRGKREFPVAEVLKPRGFKAQAEGRAVRFSPSPPIPI